MATPAPAHGPARDAGHGAPAGAGTPLVVAAGPQAPGVAAVLERLARQPAPVLLVEGGLAWLAQPEALARLAAVAEALALCSQAAREAGLDASRTPAGVRWTSVATWMATLGSRPVAWLAP